MGRRHFKPEQIIHLLREAEIKLAGGKTIGEVSRELGISEQTYYRWRKAYGGMSVLVAESVERIVEHVQRGGQRSVLAFTSQLVRSALLASSPQRPLPLPPYPAAFAHVPSSLPYIALKRTYWHADLAAHRRKNRYALPASLPRTR